MREMTKAEVTAEAERHAQIALAVIGEGHQVEYLGTEGSPCEGRLGELAEDSYSYSHVYQVRGVPPDQQVSLLQRLRDQLARRGYAIKEFRTWPEQHSASVTAHSKTDGYELNAETTNPPEAIGLSVDSPCFRMRDAQP